MMKKLYYNQIYQKISLHSMKSQLIAYFVLIYCLIIDFVSSQTCAYNSGCDPRCLNLVCDLVGSSINCCDGCQAFGMPFYRQLIIDKTNPLAWTTTYSKRCSSQCPAQQYPNSSTTCGLCDRNCTTCTGPLWTQCKTCAPDSYQLNSTACFNQPPEAYGHNPCPDPYYGIQKTMQCQICPPGCSSCNIYLQNLMPNTYMTNKIMLTDCALDVLCGYTLRCYTCFTVDRYFLQEGLCFRDECRKYQLYNSTAGSFDAALCYCMAGYYKTGSTCSRCNYNCQSCSLTAANCTACPIGYTLAAATGGACLKDATTFIRQDWTSNPINTFTTGTFALNGTFGTNTSTYASSTWLLGFSTYTISTMISQFPNVKVTYTASTFTSGTGTTAHYGIHFRGSFLFIDQWTSTQSIIFRQGGKDIYAYNYLMQTVKGEYITGMNYHDHIAIVDFWFPHSSASVSLTIEASAVKFAWGVKDIMIEELQCHTSCQTCKGPAETDCLSCKTATRKQVLVNNDCVCDTANSYYLNGGSCLNTACAVATPYKDDTTRSCVSTCPFPRLFVYNGFCYQKCPVVDVLGTPTPTYRKWNVLPIASICVLQCFDPAITNNSLNFYKFNGADQSCYNQCPAGTYGDPNTKSCVSTCPSNYITYGFFADGKFCVSACGTGKWAFPGTRTCVSTCPAGYYTNTKNAGSQRLCELECSVTLAGTFLYGNNITNPNSCVSVTQCPVDTYADIATHMCLGNCNATAFKQIQPVALTRTCQTLCQSVAYNLFGNRIDNRCVVALQCPNNTYGDYQSTFCQHICTAVGYYGDNATRSCKLTCGTGWKHNDTKTCVKTCPNKNAAGLKQYGDPVTGFCQTVCTGLYYADNQNNSECVLKCGSPPTYSTQTYGQGSVCVFNCSSTRWADPLHATRICALKCTWVAGDLTKQSYGHNSTRKCLTLCPDTQYGQVISLTPVCVFVCQNNEYGNPLTNLCVPNCPSPYYGDPNGNRTCVLDCLVSGFYAFNLSAVGVDTLANRTCVQICTIGWADNITRTCAMTPYGCSQGLYAHETNNKCVLPADCTGFADPTTKKCVPVCPFDTITHRWFGDRLAKTCVQICPSSPDYYGDNSTKQCELTCQTSGHVRDHQNIRRCVPANNCSRLPLALFGDSTKLRCVVARQCTAGTFGDNNTMKCQADCQGTTTLLYADPESRQCVNICQLGYFSLNTTVSLNVGICNRTCPVPLWADNITVRCTSRCSALTYGVNTTNATNASHIYGTCEKQCPLLQFARDIDNLCLLNCGADHWGQTVTRKCLTSPFACPTGFYADNQTNMCVIPTSCSVVNDKAWVADNQTKQCVPDCPLHSVVINWADMTKKWCVAKCPQDKYGDNITLKCVDQCKTIAGVFDGRYADPQLRICVVVCSAAPIPTFGENTTYKCVEARNCPATQYADDQYNVRVCVSKCPDPRINPTFVQMFADDISKKCVFQCPTLYFGNVVNQSNYGVCVSVCPPFANGTLKFADNSTRKCVKQCPLSQATFGDQVLFTCVKVCPSGWFAQRLHVTNGWSRYCVQTCDIDTWSQHIGRTCVQTAMNCPTINGLHWYGLNSTKTCVQTCPQAALPANDLWGQNFTYTCQLSCRANSFKYIPTRVCINLCPGSLDDDGLFSDQGMCYSQCVTAGFYRDPQNARSCQQQCSFAPVKYFADDTTMKCVLVCPSYPKLYYAYQADKKCRLDCPLTTMKDQKSRYCVSVCPTNTFFDVNSDSCVSDCPSDYSLGVIWYGDISQTIPACVTAELCNTTYFADDNVQLCVQTCSQNQWKYNKNCIVHCPDGYYGNKNTGFCVVPNDCPSSHYADNLTRLCVSVCTGSYADTNNKRCVNICPDTYFADQTTRLCSQSCTNNATISLHKNLANKTCVSQCAEGLFLNPTNNLCESSCADPLYQDPTTQMCVSVCPSAPPLYGQNDTNKCVPECSNLTNQFKWDAGRLCVTFCPNGLKKNNISRKCVEECYDNTFADTVFCVTNCTPKYSLEDPNICTINCPSPYYKDPTTFKCVLSCPTHPSQYYKVVTTNERKCDTSCPSTYFRDDLTYSCVLICPPSPQAYADPLSGNCTSVCSQTYYAHVQTRTCKTTCPGTMVADPLSRKCVNKCGNDMFGDSTLAIPACVYLCSSGRFANPSTQKCQSVCGTAPKTYGFDNITHRVCLESCPFPYIANNQSGLCEVDCLSTLLPYLDKSTEQCVSKCNSPMYQFAFLPTGQTVDGQCVKFCPNGFFANLANNTCMAKCPNALYGDTTNNTCYSNCSLANNRFADPVINRCVDTCVKYNDSADYYADLYSRRCVTSCPVDKFTVKDNTTRKCLPRCTNLSHYADPTTGYCVSMCPLLWYADPVTLTCVQDCTLYSQMYMYETNRSCVPDCKALGLYKDQFQRTCISPFFCQGGYWGLNSTGQCVDMCPTTPDLYGDIVTKTCVSACPNQTTGSQNYYSDFSTRQCVKVCPQVPALFARNDTKSCVSECPLYQFADNYTRKCVSHCSLIPSQTFADNSTNRCVLTCPIIPNYFASKQTYECVKLCSSNPKMYADYSTRTCVSNCPGGDLNTYADESTRFCVRLCPGSTYMQNSTRTCQAICKTGYADPLSKYCIAVCPPFTYGHVGAGGSKTCKPACPAQTPAIYAEDGNNLCMTGCLLVYKTFRDTTTSRCVKICPINESMFADTVSRICRTLCPANYYADNSTRYCVDKCPKIPALFAILDTRVCTSQCPPNSWADNLTRKCILDKCPSTPDTYADSSTWTCVSECPTQPMTWADNSTRSCVPGCPPSPDYYADNNTRKCVFNCSQQTYADSTTRFCVETCPEGWFGVNSTRRCTQTCPSGQFADELLNLCVLKCSVNPVFYGNPDNKICVQQCPNDTHSFGNPLSQQCVKYQANGFSGCPPALFAENYTRLCVQVCPLTRDTYSDNSTLKCVSVCPAGTQNTFSDNSTMRCVKTCPTYPEYYAQTSSRRCVSLCLQATPTFKGSFSDNSTRLCVQTCPSEPDYYSDNSTRRCVFNCPKFPLTFADNQTRRCVTTCPSTPDIYGDMSTGRCVDVCPQNEQTFADFWTRLCVKVCPSSPPLFAVNNTNRCEYNCPEGQFADNSSRICVAVCPQYPDTYGDSSTNKCVSICPSDPDLYADPLTQKCVVRCPQGYYAQNTTRRCLPDCPQDKINYADKKTNKCVARCPDSPQIYATYGDNRTRDCVVQCPAVPFTYADNMTRICLAICNNVTLGGYAQNSSRVCVTKCPDGEYGDITTRYCVRYCPEGWYSLQGLNMCVRECPSPYFSDPTTQKCVTKCPVTQLLFGNSFSRTCTPMCPQTTYADFDTQQCVNRCPSKAQNLHAYDTFGYNQTNQCVEECPAPLYGYPVSYVCVDICPDPYYENITDHRCYKCPDECATCNYPQACLTCIQGNFLYAGSCVQTCPTFPVITYANPNRECGSSFQCTPGYFALNTTKSCVQTCPQGFFKNNMQQSCNPCQRGCSTCTNSSYCIVCNHQTAIWFQFQCYTFCSPLKQFYTDQGCTDICPVGTYLQLTTCYACSSVCKTCIVQPENCITCADGLYLSNNLCVQKCPDRSKAMNLNNSLVCMSCDVVSCQTKPLTYEVSQFVDNFQFKFQLKFSQPVNIMDQIQNIISIKRKSTKRLLATTFQYLDYTIIDYGDGTYEFILNDYDSSQGDGQFQFQINNPQKILSESGELPQSTRVTIQIDSSNAYSMNDFIQAFSLYNTVLISLSMFLLLGTFWTSYTIFTPMFDFMQIMFSIFLININLPPTAMYALGVFKYSFLTFLPNFFQPLLPTPIFNTKIMSNSVYSMIKDFTFLRTMGQLYFLLILGLAFGIIIYVLSKRCFSKRLKSWCKDMWKQKILKKYLYQVVNVLFLPVVLIGLMNLRNYKINTSIEGFSIFSSWLFMVTCLVVAGYFAFKLRKLSKDSPIMYLMLQKAYNFITFQKITLMNNQNNYFTHEKNQVDLKIGRQPRINQLRILPYDLQTRIGPVQVSAPLVSFGYKLLISIFILAGYENPMVQIFFLILINIAYIVYLIVKKPYVKIGWKQFTSEITIHNLIVCNVLLLIILLFKVQLNSLSSDEKSLIAVVISVVVMYGVTVNFGYFVYRTYNYYYDNVWKVFVETDLFKDNYNLEYLELSKKYAEKEQLLKKQARPRAQFLQAIKVQNGEALANMVLRDPNHTKSKQQFKQVKLRPNKSQIVSQDITAMFQSIHGEHQKSNKSAKSSERLSKFQRTKVRNDIFENIEAIKEEQYEEVNLKDKMELQSDNTSQNGQENLLRNGSEKKKLISDVKDNQQEDRSDLISDNDQDEFEFEYVEEQYPQGTSIDEIMKGCKKGEVAMP